MGDNPDDLFGRRIDLILCALESYYNQIDLFGIDDEDDEIAMESDASSSNTDNDTNDQSNDKSNESNDDDKKNDQNSNNEKNKSNENQKKSEGVKAALKSVLDAIREWIKDTFGNDVPANVELSLPEGVADPQAFITYYQNTFNKIIMMNDHYDANREKVLDLINEFKRKSEQYMKLIEEKKDKSGKEKTFKVNLSEFIGKTKQVCNQDFEASGIELDIIREYMAGMKDIQTLITKHRITENRVKAGKAEEVDDTRIRVNQRAKEVNKHANKTYTAFMNSANNKKEGE